MEPANYPLFIPPLDLVEKGREAWSRAEADRHSDWLQSVLPLRVGGVLRFLDLPQDRLGREELLDAGARVEVVLKSGAFDGGEHGLSNEGLAVAADLGLLVASMVRRDRPGIRWKVIRRPRSHISFNLPALHGFDDRLPVEPILLAISNCYAIQRGEEESDIWVRIYDHCLVK